MTFSPHKLPSRGGPVPCAMWHTSVHPVNQIIMNFYFVKKPEVSAPCEERIKYSVWMISRTEDLQVHFACIVAACEHKDWNSGQDKVLKAGQLILLKVFDT
jgi:hypothetical protein